MASAGRIFTAARSHTFEQLAGAIAGAIDEAFARWDRAHLQEFTLAGCTRLWVPGTHWGVDEDSTEDIGRVKLSRLCPGEQLVCVFDLGDDWAHLCTVGPERADPLETLGIVPDHPLPYRGWGDTPDQYSRRWDGDNGESQRPRDPKLADLPALHPHWGRERGGDEQAVVIRSSPAHPRPGARRGAPPRDLEPLRPVALRGGRLRPRASLKALEERLVDELRDQSGGREGTEEKLSRASLVLASDSTTSISPRTTSPRGRSSPSADGGPMCGHENGPGGRFTGTVVTVGTSGQPLRGVASGGNGSKERR